MTLHSLLVFMCTAIAALQGLVYECSVVRQTAFTFTGSFQKSADNSVTSCELVLPAGLLKHTTSVFTYVDKLSAQGDGSCGLEYIELFTGHRLCSNAMEQPTEVKLSNDTRALSLRYSTQLSIPRMTFELGFVISIDACASNNLVTSPSYVIHMPARPQTHTCTVVVDTMQVDMLIITPTEDNRKRADCSNRNINLSSNIGMQICAGRFCLEKTGVIVTQHEKVNINLEATAGCLLHWKITAHSTTTTQDICSLTGRNLLLSEGRLANPGYLRGFSGPLNCTITITGFEVVLITIKFNNLRRASCVHPLDDNSCNCGDRLLINGTAVCGHSTEERLKVYFGDVPLQLFTIHETLPKTEGFFIEYTGYSRASDICQMPSPNLTFPLLIKSPNFPNNYTSGESCTVTVDVSRIDTANLKFLAFDVEGKKDAPNCPYDYLSIAKKRYCGYRAGEIEELNLSGVVSLQLHFKSDRTTTLAGFYISIEVKPSSVRMTSHVLLPMTSASTSSTQPPWTSMVTSDSANASLPTSTFASTEEAVDERVHNSQTLAYEVLGERNENLTEVKLLANSRLTRLITVQEGNISGQTTARDNKTEVGSCGVPWYYWVASLIALLLAVLITMLVFFVKLRRLKEPECCHHNADTESSRDGLSNPAYYSQLNSLYNTHGAAGNPFYSSRDRMPAAKRIYINKNSVQTTV